MFAEDAGLTDGKLVIPQKSKKALGKIDKRGPAQSSKTSEPGGAGRKSAPSNPVVHTVLAFECKSMVE